MGTRPDRAREGGIYRIAANGQSEPSRRPVVTFYSSSRRSDTPDIRAFEPQSTGVFRAKLLLLVDGKPCRRQRQPHGLAIARFDGRAQSDLRCIC